ncbi:MULTISPECIES: hypothetical protein [Calothrix]|uniref:Uncharacterized protein n=2 Tax=Calothrix TaxID=1186 RepID=A0ABR8AFW2_9CYAN|nr:MULTISPECIES: hypothetical protein [Calothrix]MBD2198649.1 hypothetical protein [Calothrix parietina FACHB-288]MBD2227052.1 hypothetical protein [Calothrix anomala FACHB-343]
MNRNLTIQNLAIAIATKNHNPSILTFDFLKYSDIIPSDWELARQPVVNNQVSQLVFRNGVSLAAQQDLLSFVEIVGTKDISEVQIPAIAHNYVRALPNVEYQAVGIDIRGYITANQLGEEAGVENYIKTLLAPAPWQEVGNAPVKASIQLAFSLDRGQLSLNINEGKLYITEEETVPIVMFYGNFSYGAEGNTKDTRLQSIHQLIDNWQEDLKTYLDIINTKFLSSQIILRDAPESEFIAPELLIPQV